MEDLKSRINLYRTDWETLWSHMKRKEKELKRKRRWLMGLPSSKYEQEQLRELRFLRNRFLPEALLREDDVFYETVNRCVEEAYGECNVERGNHITPHYLQIVDLPKISRVLMSCLDDMTNKGLFHLATTLTGGSVRFEKTRMRMKKVIRELLPTISKRQNHFKNHSDISRQLSQLLNQACYFRQKSAAFLARASLSQHYAVKILDGLEDLPFQTLVAMHRKIRGGQGGPQLERRRSGWNRDRLINRLQKTCKKMLSELGEGDELQEPLAKAMAVAGLSLMLTTGFQDLNRVQFHRFSPEIVTLQNEIAKAIWLIKEKVRYPELKKLHLLLDPDSKISSRCLRTVIKKLLTDYLFDCNDMNTVPKSLLESLEIINRGSQRKPYRGSSKEEIREDVECILSVSAQTKQIVLDLLPEHDYSQDFADAYMEDLEESEDGDVYEDDEDDDMQKLLSNYSRNTRFHLNNLSDQLEGSGESDHISSNLPSSVTEGNGAALRLTPNEKLDGHSVERSEAAYDNGIQSVELHTIASSSIFLESGSLVHLENKDLNQYQVGKKGEYGESATLPNEVSLLHSPSGRLYDNLICSKELKQDAEMGSAKSPAEQSTYKNQYIAVQDVCDETSMVAYHLIGRMLEEYAQIAELNLGLGDELYLRGNSSTSEDSRDGKQKQASAAEDVGGMFIIRLVEEAIPSFPQRAKERLKELMSLL